MFTCSGVCGTFYQPVFHVSSRKKGCTFLKKKRFRQVWVWPKLDKRCHLRMFFFFSAVQKDDIKLFNYFCMLILSFVKHSHEQLKSCWNALSWSQTSIHVSCVLFLFSCSVDYPQILGLSSTNLITNSSQLFCILNYKKKIRRQQIKQIKRKEKKI